MAKPVALPAIHSFEERDIVRRFAEGRSIIDIAGESSPVRRRVSELLGRVCGHSRVRATEAILEYDTAIAKPAVRRKLEALDTEATAGREIAVMHTRLAVPAPAGDPVSEAQPGPAEEPPIDLDVLEVADRPISTGQDLPPADGAAAAPAVTDMQPDIEALLKGAEECGLDRPAKLAGHIREKIAELAVAYAVAQYELNLRQRIRDITSERDELMEELRRLTGKAPEPRSDDGLPLTKSEMDDIRAWAHLTNRKYPQRSRPSRELVRAYRAAIAGDPS